MAVRLWTCEQDLGQEFRQDGAIYEPADATPDASNLVAFAPDRWGVRPMGNASTQTQIYRGDREGFPAFVWPNTQGNRRVQVNDSFSPVYWVFVLAYNDGERATFLNAPTIIMYDGSNRVIGQPNGNALVQTVATTWAQTLRKNAGAFAAAVLPMARCLAEVRGPRNTGRWCLGSTVAANGWQGPMWFAMALGAEPTGDTLARIQGYLAWRFGLQDQLPASHAYRTAPPTVEIPAARGGATVAPAQAGGKGGVRVAAKGASPASGHQGGGNAGLRLGVAGSAESEPAAASGATGLRVGGSGGARVPAVAVGGSAVLRMSLSGGATVAEARLGGIASLAAAPPRRWATTSTSINALTGPDGSRTTAGGSGLRTTRAA